MESYYSWPLNNTGVRGWPLPPVKNLCITSDSPKLHLSLGIHEGLVLGPPQIQKSSDAQVSHIKWRRTMHTVGPLHPQTQPHIKSTIFNLWLVEPTRCRTRDTESQLYIYWKKYAYKWTCVVQSHVVQESVVLYVGNKFMVLLMLIKYKVLLL